MPDDKVYSYGSRTVCRPTADVFAPGHVPEGYELTECPYCGQGCYKTPQEADLPFVHPDGDYTIACALCALRRTFNHREMDAERAAREGLIP